MNCMKCGREIPAGQVFCDGCLEVMKKYPVKPDAAIHLPRRRPQTAPKKQPPRRRQLSPEEQVPLLKRSCRRMALCITVLTLLLAAAVTIIFFQWKNTPAPLPMGRNYTVDTTGQD